nr:hypothetical protein [Rhodothermus bifroesti]
MSLVGRTEGSRVYYTFSRAELMELRTLLEGAQAMLALEALLRQTLHSA